MTSVSAVLDHLPVGAAYPVIAVAVLAESVLLVGAFVPTLTLLLTAGALARAGHLHPVLVVAVAAGAVLAGDFLAYRTGRLLGSRLRTAGVARRVPGRAWQRTEALMTRHGGRAVLLARFVPVVRTLTPHLVGAARLPYRRMAPYSAVGALLWSAAEVAIGYSAAASLHRVLSIGVPVAAGALVLVTCALLWAGRERAAVTR